MKFFVLETWPRLKGSFSASSVLKVGGWTKGAAPQCPECGGFIGALRWLPPYRAEIEVYGREYPDVAFGTHEWFLVSNEFRDVWRQSELSGLSGFDPVELLRVSGPHKDRGQMPRYLKVDVGRTEAAVDRIRSAYQYAAEPIICPVCRIPSQDTKLLRYKRIVLEEGSWSGEDVFLARGASAILVTKRFKDLCESAGIKNAIFVPAERYGHDFYPWERDGWKIQLFDATLAILNSENLSGKLDRFIQAMGTVREKVATEQNYDWVEELRQQFGADVKELADATSKAYYNLQRNP